MAKRIFKKAFPTEEEKIIVGDGFFASIPYGTQEMHKEKSIRFMNEQLKQIGKVLRKEKQVKNTAKGTPPQSF